MPVVFCGIAPHPPIIVPEVGKDSMGEASSTVDAMKAFGEMLYQKKPDTIIFFTPHGVIFRDAISVNIDDQLVGSLAQFGDFSKYSFSNDEMIAEAIITKTKEQEIPIIELDKQTAKLYKVTTNLDHGIIVPLHYIRKAGFSGSVVPINIAMLDYEMLYSFGVIIQDVCESLPDKKIAVVASGDLSHRLKPGAPAGYNPNGKVFDAKLVKAIKDKDINRIMNLGDVLIEEAGECGLRSIIMLMGVLDGFSYNVDVLSYEGPFGVGYLVATMQNIEKDDIRRYHAPGNEAASPLQESVHVRLARESLETYVREGRKIETPAWAEQLTRKRAGTFVSLKVQGILRGCIGTIGPVTDSIASEIIENAISAGTRDPRFVPVTERELEGLSYSVDVLSSPEPIDDLDLLDPQKYGVIVTKVMRRGLLLPNLEGIDTVAQQVAIARQKAGIASNETGVAYERFEVIRYK